MAATLLMTAVTVGGTLTQSVALSDADTVRLLAWAKSAYATDAIPSPTNIQAFKAMAQGVFSGIKANVQSFEQAAATQTAAQGVTPITLT